MKRSWSGVFLTSNKSRCWDEISVEAVWRMTLRGRTKYVLVLIWSRELYELCSAQRGRGRPPQVKQLFEDEIIVWLHLFTPMAQRGSAKQHNWLCYLIAASTSLCKDIFQFSVWLKGHFVQPLALSSDPLLSNHASDRLFVSSNKKFILDMSAKGITWCMCALNTTL